MKSLGKAWNQVISFENLLRAYEHARKGKRSRYGVQRFELERERNLLALQAELANGSYRPGPHRTFRISFPKPRLIAAAPFRDRVVQHALCRVIQPFFEKSFIDGTYACILGRGTHKAVDRYTHLARRYPYVLKMDIQRFFPSVDHEILLDLLCRRLPEPEIRRLIGLILATGQDASEPVCIHMPGDTLLTPLERPHGLPIGNLTSQLWANIYLDGLDHFITETLGHGAYLRYMDDFVVLADDKKRLHDVLEQVKDWLACERRLRLHENKCHIRNVKEGLTFLGYRVWPDHRRVRRDNVVRARRRVRSLNRRYALGRIDIRGVRASLMAWMGHTRHANARGLERHIVSKMSLQHATQ